MTITITKEELTTLLDKHKQEMVTWREDLIPAVLNAVEFPSPTMSPIDQIRLAVSRHCEKLPTIKFL